MLQTTPIQTIATAFAGGVVSSFLPCTLGMLPILLGYIGAYGAKTQRGVLLQSLCFILGLASLMSVLGVSAAMLGMVFGQWHQQGLYLTIATLSLLMGLQLLGVIRLPLPAIFKRIPVIATASKNDKPRYGQVFLLGAVFGLTASPCGTPYLAGILGLIAYQKQWLTGGLALFAYALGQSILLLLAGLGAGWLKNRALLYQVGHWLEKLSGLLFIVVSGLLFYQAFSS